MNASLNDVQLSFANFEDRETLYTNHPVVTTRFEFPTPPLIRAVDAIMPIIAAGGPGCAFCAYPRFGKSRAINYCCARLPEVFPRDPIVSFHAHLETISNARNFFADLYKQSGYTLKKPIPPRDIRDMLVRAWFMECVARGSKRLIFFGDEMQRLTPNEYTWLIDVSNDLEQLGIRMTSILFGQPELASLRAMLKRSSRGDILGRFMSRWFAFGGISSALELQEVFRCYDDPEHGEYPDDSGIAFSQFFIPDGYKHGWRLASCAGLCWELFLQQANERLGRSSIAKVSIGMEWVALAVQYALTHFGDEDRPKFTIAKDQWSKAIKRSGFADSVELTFAATDGEGP